MPTKTFCLAPVKIVSRIRYFQSRVKIGEWRNPTNLLNTPINVQHPSQATIASLPPLSIWNPMQIPLVAPWIFPFGMALRERFSIGAAPHAHFPKDRAWSIVDRRRFIHNGSAPLPIATWPSRCPPQLYGFLHHRQTPLSSCQPCQRCKEDPFFSGLVLCPGRGSRQQVQQCQNPAAAVLPPSSPLSSHSARPSTLIDCCVINQ